MKCLFFLVLLLAVTANAFSEMENLAEMENLENLANLAENVKLSIDEASNSPDEEISAEEEEIVSQEEEIVAQEEETPEGEIVAEEETDLEVRDELEEESKTKKAKKSKVNKKVKSKKNKAKSKKHAKKHTKKHTKKPKHHKKKKHTKKHSKKHGKKKHTKKTKHHKKKKTTKKGKKKIGPAGKLPKKISLTKACKTAQMKLEKNKSVMKASNAYAKAIASSKANKGLKATLMKGGQYEFETGAPKYKSACNAAKGRWAIISSQIPAGAAGNPQAVYVIWYACLASKCDNAKDILALESALQMYGLNSAIDVI